VALEMVSQSGGAVKKLVVLDGYSSLVDTIFKDKKDNWDVFSEFVDHHILSAQQRVRSDSNSHGCIRQSELPYDQALKIGLNFRKRR
jgi:hypothetical protein